jgi:hypothetical protein
MQNNTENPQHTPEEELKAQNEVLKLKLGLEHGMQEYDCALPDPAAENQWLNNIYDFEQAFKNAKRVKIYDFIGRPTFKKAEKLSREEIAKELDWLLSVMEEKGIALVCLCDYEDEIIYRFIIEELFEEETDDMALPGWTTNFIYEEFHPNHDYDLRKHSSEFIQNLLEREWHPEFHSISLADVITFNGKEYDREGIMKIILAFQESNGEFLIEKNEIGQVNFDLETNAQGGRGTVQGQIRYSSVKTNQWFEGRYVLHFALEFDYWSVCNIQLEGFSG